MTKSLIDNAELRATDVPYVRAAQLAEEGFNREWAAIWRFALTFDANQYAAATGKDVDTVAVLEQARLKPDSERLAKENTWWLRTALFGLYWQAAGRVYGADVALVDALLDGLHLRLSGGKPRPAPERAEPELRIGTLAHSVPGAQVYRHAFYARQGLGRPELYDGIAGLLARNLPEAFALAALSLESPAYSLPDNRVRQIITIGLVHVRGAAVEPDFGRLLELIDGSFATPGTSGKAVAEMLFGDDGAQ